MDKVYNVFCCHAGIPLTTVVPMWVTEATVEVDSQTERYISWHKIDSH